MSIRTIAFQVGQTHTINIPTKGGKNLVIIGRSPREVNNYKVLPFENEHLTVDLSGLSRQAVHVSIDQEGHTTFTLVSENYPAYLETATPLTQKNIPLIYNIGITLIPRQLHNLRLVVIAKDVNIAFQVSRVFLSHIEITRIF